jgi:hypothetical protein
VPGGGGVHAHWCYPWVDVLVRCVDGLGESNCGGGWMGEEGWKR